MKVISIIVEQLKKNHDDLCLSTILTDQGADEFDMIEIVMKFEDHFGIIIEDQAVRTCSTVEGAVAHIIHQKSLVARGA